MNYLVVIGFVILMNDVNNIQSDSPSMLISHLHFISFNNEFIQTL